MQQVNVKVDGQGLNASHFAKFKEEEAVKRLVKDFNKDESWAKKAYSACVTAVKDAEEAEKKALAEAAKKKQPA